MAGAMYFVFRIWNFPSISLTDAFLVGIALTSATILCSYGITSGHCNVYESPVINVNTRPIDRRVMGVNFGSQWNMGRHSNVEMD
jgi:hypothetical protein